MGMYTELYLGVELSKDTPKHIVKWLEAHNSDDYETIAKLTPIELNATRLETLCCSSYYFDAQPHFLFRFDDIAGAYFLTFGCNIKNYSNEIATFVDMLRPYILTDDHIGHIRYEEDRIPTLLYNNKELR